MAFGTVAGFFVFVMVVVIGCIGIDASIAGIVLSSIAKAKGKKFGKPVLVISTISFVLSMLIATVPPIALGVTIGLNENMNFEAPATDVIIEESGYQEKSFTVNGVVYERVEVDNIEAICGEELSGPIFSYNDKFLFFDRWGTYDKLENDHGFNLVVGEYVDEIFCPSDEKKDVEAFYSDDNNYEWYFDYDNYYNYIDDECQEVLNELLETKKNASETVRIIEEACDKYFFQQLSKDSLFFKDEIEIFANDGKYYLEIPSDELFGDTENPGTEVVEIDKADGEKLINLID